MINQLINPASGHAVICGMTSSGKTTLAFALCAELKRRGQICLALDENMADWPCEVTDDHELFYAKVWEFAQNPKNNFKELYKEKREPFINIFIDECGEYGITEWNKLKKFLTRGRQYGIRVFLLSQRYCLMNKTARLQCRTFYIFKQGKSDTNEIRDLTSSEKFDLCAGEMFPDLHFVYKSGIAPCKYFQIIFDKRKAAGVTFKELDEIIF